MEAEHAGKDSLRGDVVKTDIFEYLREFLGRVEHLQRVDEILLTVARRGATAEEECCEPEARAQILIIELLDHGVGLVEACRSGKSDLQALEPGISRRMPAECATLSPGHYAHRLPA